LERVVVAADGHGFALANSQRSFHPWGLNYGNAGRLMEDFWENEWGTFASDFHEMKELGANVVRVHLQFGRFMDAADKPNPAALARLGQLLELAERSGLYLDVTGLACYRKADVPAWYDALDEPARWAAQATFWQTVAARCAVSPAVFCYDLMNEPISPAERRQPGQWYSGKPFGGYDFIQYIACGWMGHYDGTPPEELDALERAGRLTIPQALMRDWLRLFGRLKPELALWQGESP
jgi:aryl-phospho-beta-D-glucosidase BglC (GH1 family)